MPETTAPELTDEELTAAVDRLTDVFRGDLDPLAELIENYRDEEIAHLTDNQAGECVDACTGCLAERIAEAVTRAVTGGSHA